MAFDSEKSYKRYFLGLFESIEQAKKREFDRWCRGYGINVGCGLSQLGSIGVDSSETMLAQNPRTEKLVADARNLPFPDKHFEYAFCSELLHHVDDPEKVLDEMIRVAKIVVVNEANIDNPVIKVFTSFLPFDKDAHFLDQEDFGVLLREAAIRHRKMAAVYKRGFGPLGKIWLWGVIQ